MALRLMLEFGARRPANVGRISFLLMLMLLLLLLSVSGVWKMRAGHWSMSGPGYFSRLCQVIR